MISTKPYDIANDVANHPYAWPGGYPRFAMADDGGCFCAKCCKNEAEMFTDTFPGDGWYLTADDINWEDHNLYCDHCGELIEAAY